jgi:hypothetical protein
MMYPWRVNEKCHKVSLIRRSVFFCCSYLWGKIRALCSCLFGICVVLWRRAPLAADSTYITSATFIMFCHTSVTSSFFFLDTQWPSFCKKRDDYAIRTNAGLRHACDKQLGLKQMTCLTLTRAVKQALVKMVRIEMTVGILHGHPRYFVCSYLLVAVCGTSYRIRG